MKDYCEHTISNDQNPARHPSYSQLMHTFSNNLLINHKGKISPRNSYPSIEDKFY